MADDRRADAPQRRQGAPERPRVTERSLQAQVVELAALTGWRAYWTWRSFHSPKGFPDMCLVRPPRLLFIELKSERGRTTPDQDTWLDQLGRVPCAEVYTFRPSDWDEIVEVLR